MPQRSVYLTLAQPSEKGSHVSLRGRDERLQELNHGESFVNVMADAKVALRPGGRFLVSASPPGAKGRIPHVERHTEADFARVFPRDWIKQPPHRLAKDLLISISESHRVAG